MKNQIEPAKTQPVEGLTHRELDILKLLALNLTDREIADRLTLAHSSVKWYARQVYAKLEVDNRHQAVAKARELGLIASTSLSRPAHNLPRQISQLIGREKEITRVVEMIWEYALITLTGPGGVGKTRLALAAAEELLDDFANGIWFVEIAPLADALLVERTLADVLGVRADPNQSLRESLIHYLRDRQALLIFDNCEHMLDACAALAGDLLKSLPQLKVLVSSRELLGVTGEAVFRVPSLSFPQDGQTLALEQMREFEAVRLFQERTCAVLPEFQLSDHNAAFVGQICRRLDGIPLAIELAAARVSSLDVEKISARLDQAFRLLAGGSRNALERHRTLRAAVDWSYNLLAEKERLLLQRLSIFVGGCTLEAAEAICAGDPILPEDIMDLLYQLTNKSMLVVEQTRAAETRYHLLETIRQYAEEKLDDPEEIERLRWRHSDWFVQFCELAEIKLKTSEDRVWMRKLQADVDNLRAVLEWSIGGHSYPQAGMRMINALVTSFWSNYYYQAEIQLWIDKGLAALAILPSVPLHLQARSLISKVWFIALYNPPDVDLYDRIFELCRILGDEGKLMRANSLVFLGFNLAFYNGDLQKGLYLLNEAEAILRPLGESGRWFLSSCLGCATFIRAQLGDLQGAFACAQESAAYHDESGDMFAGAHINLGDISYHIGNYEVAEMIYEKAILIAHEFNNPGGLDHTLRKLGDVYRAQSKFEQANSTFREALIWTNDMADWTHVVMLQCCFAFTAIGQARDLPPEDAKPHLLRTALLLGAVAPVLRETDVIFPIEYQAENDQSLLILRERLDPPVLDAAWVEGRAMKMKQVIEYLLKEEH